MCGVGWRFKDHLVPGCWMPLHPPTSQPPTMTGTTDQTKNFPRALLMFHPKRIFSRAQMLLCLSLSITSDISLQLAGIFWKMENKVNFAFLSGPNHSVLLNGLKSKTQIYIMAVNQASTHSQFSSRVTCPISKLTQWFQRLSARRLVRCVDVWAPHQWAHIPLQNLHVVIALADGRHESHVDEKKGSI